MTFKPTHTIFSEHEKFLDNVERRWTPPTPVRFHELSTKELWNVYLLRERNQANSQNLAKEIERRLSQNDQTLIDVFSKSLIFFFLQENGIYQPTMFCDRQE